MTTFLLSLLVINWLFYTACAGMILWTYHLVNDDKGSTVGATFLSGLVLAWSLYYFDSFREIALSWPNGLYLCATYLAIGFGVMGVKWIITLKDFKTQAAKWLKENPEERPYTTKISSLNSHLYNSHSKVIEIPVRVESAAGGFVESKVYSLDHRRFPLVNWCIFWPLFALSIVFDEVIRAIEWHISWWGGVLDAIAKKFSVKD